MPIYEHFLQHLIFWMVLKRSIEFKIIVQPAWISICRLYTIEHINDFFLIITRVFSTLYISLILFIFTRIRISFEIRIKFQFFLLLNPTHMGMNQQCFAELFPSFSIYFPLHFIKSNYLWRTK